jgi:hypothetical protein
MLFAEYQFNLVLICSHILFAGGSHCLMFHVSLSASFNVTSRFNIRAIAVVSYAEDYKTISLAQGTYRLMPGWVPKVRLPVDA